MARNAVLNFAGQLIPLLIAVGVTPYVIRSLGADRFGVLSIAWVLLGSFSLFDVGLSRATTRYVAELLGRGETDQLPGLVWTSLGSQFALGVVASILVGSAVTLVVDKVLRIPGPLVAETKLIVLILAGSIPIVLVAAGVRGVLEATQRFDLVNYIKVPSNASVFLVPIAVLPLGFGLPAIVFLLVVGRLITALAYGALCLRLFPSLRKGSSMNSKTLRLLVVYGGWVTVSNLVVPILSYADRVLIGSLISVAAVGYYAVPSEMVGRLLIVPGSLVLTLFPAFSSLGAVGDGKRIESAYVRAIKFILLSVGPLVLTIVIFAKAGLQIWLGQAFADRSTLVLQILAVGILINSMAFVPYSLLQGLGRPDLTAKFHVLELIICLPIAWILIERHGIVGAALAWTFRVFIDALLLFGASWRLRLFSLFALFENGFVRSAIAVMCLAIIMTLTWIARPTMLIKMSLVSVSLGLFAVVVWSYVLDAREKLLLNSLFGTMKGTG